MVNIRTFFFIKERGTFQRKKANDIIIFYFWSMMRAFFTGQRRKEEGLYWRKLFSGGEKWPRWGNIL